MQLELVYRQPATQTSATPILFVHDGRQLLQRLLEAAVADDRPDQLVRLSAKGIAKSQLHGRRQIDSVVGSVSAGVLGHFHRRILGFRWP